MKTTISFSKFCDMFRTMGRDYNFSYNGKRALFDFLEQYEKDAGEEIELDIIAFCCEYTEYESLDELKENYTNIDSMDELQNNTTVIKIDNDSFIIQEF